MQRHVAQARHLELAEVAVLRLHVAGLDRGRRIAARRSNATTGCSALALQRRDAAMAPRIDDAGPHEEGQSGVAELAVAEQRSHVAQVAAPAADEQARAALRRQRVVRRSARGRRAPARRESRRTRCGPTAACRRRRRWPWPHSPAPLRRRRRRLRRTLARSGRPARRRRRSWRARAPRWRPSRAHRAIGRIACDHRLSAAPSQPYQRSCTAFHSDGVLRSSSSRPRPRARPSAKASSGRWQLAHDSVPSIDRRASKNRRSPSAMAAGRPACALPASSARGGGHGPWRTMRRDLVVAEVEQRRRRSHAAVRQRRPRARGELPPARARNGRVTAPRARASAAACGLRAADRRSRASGRACGTSALRRGRRPALSVETVAR